MQCTYSYGLEAATIINKSYIKAIESLIFNCLKFTIQRSFIVCLSSDLQLCRLLDGGGVYYIVLRSRGDVEIELHFKGKLNKHF